MVNLQPEKAVAGILERSFRRSRPVAAPSLKLVPVATFPLRGRWPPRAGAVSAPGLPSALELLALFCHVVHTLFALALYPIGVGFVLFALQLRRMVAERWSVWEVDNALVCMSMDNSRDRGAAALQRPGDLSDRVTRRELLSGLDHELAWQALSSAQRSRTWATWWASRSGVTAPATWSCRASQDGVKVCVEGSVCNKQNPRILYKRD